MGPRKYALVGAGPMGLAMARNLRRSGIPFHAFEIHDEIGGLWNIDNPHSTMYESAHLISSKRMTEFAEFPMADEVADYPGHAEVLRYFQAYADAFDLRRDYRFGVRVVATERLGDEHWRVSWRAADSNDPGATESAEYRGANRLGKPLLPLPEGLTRAALALLPPLGLSRYGPEQVRSCATVPYSTTGDSRRPSG